MDDNQTQVEEGSELFEHHKFIVDKGQGPLRIDKYLMMHMVNASRNKIQNAAKANCVLVNDKAVKSNYKIRPEDIISVVMTHPPREVEIIPEDLPIDIIYEDNDIMIVNKAPGMVVHPGYNNYTGTLVHALTYYLLHKSPSKNEDGHPYLVHRIDKDTSGILLVAKNELAQTKLAKQFFDHSIQRKYHALVWGEPKESEGKIEGHIGRSLKNRLVMSVFPDGEHGKEAVSHYKLLKSFGYVSLLECQLETGRTHQIRAHFKHIGHTLFNDVTYGGDSILKGTTFTKYKQFIQNCYKILPRQALHAKSLGFIHPTTEKFIYFDSDLPSDFQQVVDKWDNYIASNKDLM